MRGKHRMKLFYARDRVLHPLGTPKAYPKAEPWHVPYLLRPADRRAGSITAHVSYPGAPQHHRPLRTHASAAAAFPAHCDYACAVQVFRPAAWWRRLSADEIAAFLAVGILAFAWFMGCFTK